MIKLLKGAILNWCCQMAPLKVMSFSSAKLSWNPVSCYGSNLSLKYMKTSKAL